MSKSAEVKTITLKPVGFNITIIERILADDDFELTVSYKDEYAPENADVLYTKSNVFPNLEDLFAFMKKEYFES